MTIESDFYRKMSTTESDTSHVDFVLNLEILSGCQHQCGGCYVNRKNKRIVDDLDIAVSLAKDAHANGLRFRELVLSPTDLFSADNALDVLRDPRFHQLMNIHPITRITATAMFENLDVNHFLTIFEELDNSRQFEEKMILEFLVPLDARKILSRDVKYLEEARRFVEYMKSGTPKMVDWSFVINVGMDELIRDNFDELTRIVREDFDTIIEFLPSFFRAKKDYIIQDKLEEWRSFLRTVINESNYDKIMFSSACKTHNTYSTVVVNFRGGKLYVSPFVYEQVMLEHPSLEISAPTVAAIDAKIVHLAAEQFTYANKCDNCATCPMIATCVGRNVLSFMESQGMTECPFPHDVLMTYYRDDALPIKMVG